MVSGAPNRLAAFGDFIGLQAAHLFPLAKEMIWRANDYRCWVMDMDDAPESSRINSIQNGLLMSESLHSCFDQYLFSINPDDGYKIISFVPDNWGVDGRILELPCREPSNPHHVSDELLRWHFRQGVLANMRGAGEPTFDNDFPPRRDQMAVLRSEPYGKERLEMEVSERLKCATQRSENHAH
ncbi:hypothetical protein L228DRAFT_122791 [Xylona heveae TC161]|uniref:HNH nuclease domain-containing protein n=1 Tax=Xylona heveae (strain CBS 132557 / TC161) TaxID=1328760 RepID=A0A161TD17_XYLHT|nr:hypothetical protein L228DRAFT_122791 [Xylona heveae TC161]KZF23717.1 hypothetical protein L228DRAFT_122791 [Xylona heveae TC161]